jgi:hypothetical protein
MKFNFDIKLIFFIFCPLFGRREKKWPDFGGSERKSWLKPIPAMKTSGFGVNVFLLM